VRKKGLGRQGGVKERFLFEKRGDLAEGKKTWSSILSEESIEKRGRKNCLGRIWNIGRLLHPIKKIRRLTWEGRLEGCLPQGLTNHRRRGEKLLLRK